MGSRLGVKLCIMLWKYYSKRVLTMNITFLHRLVYLPHGKKKICHVRQLFKHIHGPIAWTTGSIHQWTSRGCQALQLKSSWCPDIHVTLSRKISQRPELEERVNSHPIALGLKKPRVVSRPDVEKAAVGNLSMGTSELRRSACKK